MPCLIKSYIFGEIFLLFIIGEGMAMSKVLTTIQYFVDNIALIDVTEFSKQFDTVSDVLYTPKETEEYNR
jgi:hypothetical protein